jgi:hypothetical protein
MAAVLARAAPPPIVIDIDDDSSGKEDASQYEYETYSSSDAGGDIEVVSEDGEF